MFNRKFYLPIILACSLTWLTPTVSAENSKDYEGWAWDTKLAVYSSHAATPIQDPAIETSHLKMQKIIYTDKSVKGWLGLDKKTEKKEDGKNAVLLRLGVIVREGTAKVARYTYKPTNCFKRLIGFSGSESLERLETLDLRKFSALYQIDPVGYSFVPRDILLELSARFPIEVAHTSTLALSTLSPIVY